MLWLISFILILFSLGSSGQNKTLLPPDQYRTITRIPLESSIDNTKPHEVIDMIPSNSLVQIISNSNDRYYYIDYKGTKGFISYIAFVSKQLHDYNNNASYLKADNSIPYKSTSSIDIQVLPNDEEEISLPPILAIEEITFSTTVLDALETASISISIVNKGPGEAQNVYVTLTSSIPEINFPVNTYCPPIAADGGRQYIVIDITGNIDLPETEATLGIEVVEPNHKVKIPGKQLRFETRQYESPELILAQISVIENKSAIPNNQIDLNEIIELKFAIQNIGQGLAEDVRISVNNNQTGVKLLDILKEEEIIKENTRLGNIRSGEYIILVYRYFINSEFIGDQLQFAIQTTERHGSYGFSENKSFSINSELEVSGQIRTVAKPDDNKRNKVVIEDLPEFQVDVDSNIPSTNIKQDNTYALIIGNEDYASRQNGLSKEQNVPFAVNDAKVFSHYCELTLGIPRKQIKVLYNATAGEINQGLAWLSNLSKVEKGKAKLVFYYSGHGLPDNESKEPFIIPVDISGLNLEYAIKLSEVYSMLNRHPAKQITVFLDACFSGSGRDQGLLTLKGVKINPKKDQLSGNLVVFSSSTGSETSAVYQEKKHGYFTYYLLKKLQDSEGDVPYFELGEFLIDNVSKETGLNGIIQTPQISPSPYINEKWKLWQLK